LATVYSQDSQVKDDPAKGEKHFVADYQNQTEKLRVRSSSPFIDSSQSF
jgi:hypothetical protein